ncbi:MAG: hypothetical protein GY862_13515, partial [Gammaproteobacteria bacterium]|nr:hypothetical protein [Gammaproteobacteria bacterium]
MSLNEKTLKSSFKQSLKKLGDAAPDVEAAVSDEINAFIARTDFSALQAAEINLVLQQQLGVIFDAFNLGFDAKGRDFVGGDVADVLAAEIQSAQAFLDASTPIHEQAQVFVSDFVQKTFGGADDIGAQVEAELNSFIGNTDFSDMDLSAVSHALNDEISSIYAELGVDIETVSAERNEAFSASAHLEKLLGGSAITGAYDELLSGAEGYARALEEWGKQTGIHAAAPDPSGDYEGAGDPSFMQRQNIMFSALHNQGKLGKGDKMTADLGFIKDA